MTITQFEDLYKYKKSHEAIEIHCNSCDKIQTPLKTRAKQTLIKRGEYLCPSCGQSKRHEKNPMTEETKNKISQSVKNYYDNK